MKKIMGVASVLPILYVFYLVITNGKLDAAIFVFLFLGILLASIYKHFEKVKELLSQKKIKQSVLLSSVMLVGILTFLEINIYIGAKEDVPEVVDYIVVLGAGVINGEVSLALKERLDTAYDYAKNKPDAGIIVTGGVGFGEEKSEGEVMKAYLIAKGIDEKRITAETKATSTYENLLYTEKIIGKEKDIAIITNDFHLYRAKKLAERMDLNAYGIPAKTPTSILVQTHVREYLAIVKSYIFDKK